jgi:hypothetical protein
MQSELGTVKCSQQQSSRQLLKIDDHGQREQAKIVVGTSTDNHAGARVAE